MINDIALASAYFNSRPFLGTMIFQNFLSILAIFTNLRFLREFRKETFYHVNVKTIMICLIGFNVQHSICSVVLTGFHIVWTVSAATADDMILPMSFCNFLRAPCSLTVYTQTFLYLSIVVERIIATVTKRKYERSEVPLAAVILVVLSLLFGITLIGVVVSQQPSDLNVPFCSWFHSRATSLANGITILLLILVLSSLIGIVTLYLYSKNLRTRRLYDITASFQVAETLLVTKSFIILILFHTIVNSLFYISAFCIFWWANQDPERLSNYLPSIYILLLMQFLLMPSILRYIKNKSRRERNRMLRDLLKKEEKLQYNYAADWN